ncbi:MAG TPA: hypothetical protein VNC78_09225 [Actinomycetota bacterium]|nr:hypothetical protein [Actinomycetota bacterium]
MDRGPRSIALLLSCVVAFGSLGSAAPAVPLGQTEPPPDALSAYRGLATWIDIYDKGPWKHPRVAVSKMADRGVQTLFLETGNYRIKSRMFRPARIETFIESAHEHGIEVVAWFVPSLKNLDRDLTRVRAALDFVTAGGQSFDSFALDIEATVERDIEQRNRNARRLSRRVRAAAGADYPLGAIIPEAGALYWPGFPYSIVSEVFDVALPMAYFSYRTSGYAGVYDFIASNVAAVREGAGPGMPVHVIGGIAEDSLRREVRAMVKAAADAATIGASLYDFPTTTRGQWEVLQDITGDGAS